jgi:hypothetical protein
MVGRYGGIEVSNLDVDAYNKRYGKSSEDLRGPKCPLEEVQSCFFAINTPETLFMAQGPKIGDR